MNLLDYARNEFEVIHVNINNTNIVKSKLRYILISCLYIHISELNDNNDRLMVKDIEELDLFIKDFRKFVIDHNLQKTVTNISSVIKFI